MKKIIFFDCTLVFEPGVNTWQRVGELYDDLADFFSLHGLRASQMDSENERKILYIEGMDRFDKLLTQPDFKDKQVGPQKALKRVIKQASESK